MALIAAVFVIVVLALVGTLLVRVATTSLHTSDRELMATRAIFAARSAAEWGIYQVIAKEVVPNQGERPFKISGNVGEGLEECVLGTKVEGSPDSVNETGFGSRDLYLRQLRVLGQCHGDIEQVARKVEVDFWTDW